MGCPGGSEHLLRFHTENLNSCCCSSAKAWARVHPAQRSSTEMQLSSGPPSAGVWLSRDSCLDAVRDTLSSTRKRLRSCRVFFFKTSFLQDTLVCWYSKNNCVSCLFSWPHWSQQGFFFTQGMPCLQLERVQDPVPS